MPESSFAHGVPSRAVVLQHGLTHRPQRQPGVALQVVQAPFQSRDRGQVSPAPARPDGAPRRTPAARSPTPPPPHAAARARGLTADECDAILATCTQRRRTGRGLDEREEVAERRGLVDGAIVGLLSTGRSAAARWRRSAGPTSTSPTARTSSSPSPARMSGVWSAAARPRSNRLHAGDDAGAGRPGRRPRRRPDQPALRRRLRRRPPRRTENLARRPRARRARTSNADPMLEPERPSASVDKPVSEITSVDLLHILAPIWHAEPETARRVRQRIGAGMKWAVADVEHRDGADHGGEQRRPRQGVDGIGRGERRGRRDWRRRRRRR